MPKTTHTPGRFLFKLTSFSTSYGFTPLFTFATDNLLKALEYSDLIFRMMLEIDSNTTICRIQVFENDEDLFCHGYMTKIDRVFHLQKGGMPWFPLTSQHKNSGL